MSVANEVSSRTTAPKLLIQMSGAPGSGKSTLTRLLRPSIDGIIIDHDILRSTLLDSTATCFEQAAKQSYDLQWALARDYMKQGIVSIIMDSTCNYNQVLEQGISLAAEYGYTYWYIQCKVGDIDLLGQRLRARESMASQRSGVDQPPGASEQTEHHGGEDARARFTRWMENPCRPADDSRTIVVDSTGDLASLHQQILHRLTEGNTVAK